MKYRKFYHLLISAAFIVSIGCGVQIDSTLDHVKNGEFNSALALVKGHPHKESLLAAALLEQDAMVSNTRARTHILKLGAAGDPGHATLKRIRKSDAQSLAGQLAQIVLHRGDKPKRVLVMPYLTSEWSDVRATATTSWVTGLPQDLLVKLTEDTDARVRTAAVNALGKKGFDANVSTILVAILRSDPNPSVRSSAARNGPALGDAALDALNRALLDENLGVQTSAIMGLGKLDTPEATARIRDCTFGPQTELGVIAAAELAHKGESDGQRRMRDALTHTDPTIRATGLIHLTRANLEDDVKLRADRLNDQDSQVVFLAAGSLLDNPAYTASAIEALKRIWQTPNKYGNRAVFKLAEHGYQKAIDHVRKTIDDAGRGNDALLIQQIANASMIRELRSDFVDLLAHSESDVRIAAATAILSQNI